MATFLFWNLNKKPALPLVRALCAEHDVDVVALAESPASEVELLTELNRGEDARFFLPSRPWQSRVVTVVSTYPTRYLRPLVGGGRFAILRLAPPIGGALNLVMVQLASNLYQEEADQALLTTELADDIARAEQDAGDTRTVVYGDFNMDPFEPGLVGAQCLHAVMDRRVAARERRVVQEREYTFLYNPMWSFLGDLSAGPPGTYYYDRSGRPINYYWNTFDQVLVRPALIDSFRHDRLVVPTMAGGERLLSDSGHPTPSDHLPLVFQVDL